MFPNRDNNSSRILLTILLILIFQLLLVEPVSSGPVNVRNRRMIREIYIEHPNEPTTSSTIQNDTTHVATLGIGACLLDGQTIPKATVTCEMKPGCRAIQKIGYCCPEYQCECERDGKTYSDGAKLDKVDPCKFCSCRGGEIVCSTVTCYNRDNCEPKFIPGTCCPVYDNCPLIGLKVTTTQHPTTTTTTTSLNPPSLIVSPVEKTPCTSSQNNKQPEMPHLNITIKEITKKEEIRIVDQKPKTTTLQQQQSLSPATIIATASAAAPAALLNTSAAEHEILPISQDKTSELASTKPNHGTLTDDNFDELSIDSVISSTNSPVLASETDSNSTSNSKSESESESENTPLLMNTVKIVRGTNSLNINKTIPDNSTTEIVENIESSEFKTKQNLTKHHMNHEEVTEQVIFFDEDGQSKTIPVFDVKWLQRGDVVDESSDHMLTSTVSVSSSELIYGNSNEAPDHDSSEEENSDFDPIASSSDDFIRVVISSTTEESIDEFSDSNNNTLTISDDNDTILYSAESEALLSSNFKDGILENDEQQFQNSSNEIDNESLPINDKQHQNLPLESFEISESSSETSSSIVSTTSSDAQIHNVEIEYDVTPIENPAYPVIREDDLSIYQREVNESEDYSDIKEEPRSSLNLNQATNTPKIQTHSIEIVKQNSNNNESAGILILGELKNDDIFSSAMGQNLTDLDTSNESYILYGPEARAPGEPCLIPEWERYNLSINFDNRCNSSTSAEEDLNLFDVLKGNDSSADDDDDDDNDVALHDALKHNNSSLGDDLWQNNESIELDLGSGGSGDTSNENGVYNNGSDIGYDNNDNNADNGSGSHLNTNLFRKDTESTTARHKKFLDIDELNESNVQQNININNNNNNEAIFQYHFNPKDDAESVKYNSDDNSQQNSNGDVNAGVLSVSSHRGYLRSFDFIANNQRFLFH